ncbi:mucin-3B [Xenopus tropicalis]|uniref:Mucin-3B n=1 Tax=Xenopus tropicalis TaxID=8364 RepID=A0A8J1JBW0_XENTR|nr:mucin-3B [Xenopus tropicalis]
MKITNKEFDSSMEDNSSLAFKQFEEEFKAQMKSIYSNVSNYKDVIIRSLSKGSIVVDYEIILEMEYNLEVDVNESYAEIFKIVQEELLSRATLNCSDENGSFCFQELDIKEVPVPTAKELCMELIEPGYKDFFTAKLTPNGLFCISHCEEESEKYYNCNSGDCKLEKTGPECFCPKTDIYLYTTSRCKGRILKAGLYGGVGAGMAVLAIIILTVGILLCKSKQPRKRDPFSKDQEGKWYEDDDEWGVSQGFNKPGSEPGDNDNYKNGMTKYENFRPALENVDTRIPVKIQRPTVARR